MKSSKILLTLILIIFISTGALASNQDVNIIIDGVKLQTGAPSKIVNNHTLVPMRPIFEALGAKVGWENKTRKVTATKGNDTIFFYISEAVASVNELQVSMDSPAILENGNTLIPVRFISESLGYDVRWERDTRSVIINKQEPNYITLNGVKISIGDTLSQVESVLGKADRIDSSFFDLKWHVYNSDYSNFIMVGINKGLVEGLYTNSKGFEANGVKYGDVMSYEDNGIGASDMYVKRQNAGKVIKFSIDTLNDNKVHSCKIYPSGKDKSLPIDSLETRAQELENFDATNAFRVNYGKHPLKLSGLAEVTAKQHSQDMAKNKYFSHTSLNGLSPLDRFKNNGGHRSNIRVGENIAKSLSGIHGLNSWINSPGHRRNILNDYEYLGIGQEGIYMTQLFYTENPK